VSAAGGLFGLLGSGEFEAWSAAVDRRLLERATGDGTVLILPTASAPEGDRVFDGWASMGMEHFESVGVPSDVLPVKTRVDAEDERNVERVRAASMVYFSGGNPAYLANTLAGTTLWNAVRTGLGRGMAYAGCSAGIACLGEAALDSSIRSLDGRASVPGLRLFPNVEFGPHWDAIDRYVPGLRAFIESAVPAGAMLIGVDERTAMVGDGRSWTVIGDGSVHLKEADGWRALAAGASFDLDLTADPLKQ
jgi:cyanophycinase